MIFRNVDGLPGLVSDADVIRRHATEPLDADGVEAGCYSGRFEELLARRRRSP